VRLPAGPLVAPLLVLMLPALGACALFTDAEPKIPPLVWESGDARLIDPRSATVPPQESLPARLVLYRFLRGVAAGDVRVCGYLIPEYEQDAFGAVGGCRSGLAAERRRLGARTLAALRGVTVPMARRGPGDNEMTVRFGDLRWRTAPPEPAGLLAERFVLRRVGGRWRIAA